MTRITRPCDLTENPSVCRITLGQEDALHFVTVQRLYGTRHSDLDLHSADRDQIATQDRSIAELERIVGRSAKFVAYAAPGNIVRTDLNRKRSRVEPFLGEPEAMLAHRQLYQFRCSARVGPVHRKSGALRDGIYCNGNLLRRSERLQLRRHRIDGQIDRSWCTESMNSGLKLYGLSGRDIVERDPTVADADFVLVVQIKIEAEV